MSAFSTDVEEVHCWVWFGVGIFVVAAGAAGVFVVGRVVVVGVVEAGSALLISWSRRCLLTMIPVAAELMSVVLVSGFVGSSSRVVWYSVPGPALDPMVVI